MQIITNVDILIGIGVTFGFSFLLAKLTSGRRDSINYELFFIYVVIISSLLVSVNCFPTWVMGLDVIIVSVLIYQRWDK